MAGVYGHKRSLKPMYLQLISDQKTRDKWAMLFRDQRNGWHYLRVFDRDSGALIGETVTTKKPPSVPQLPWLHGDLS